MIDTKNVIDLKIQRYASQCNGGKKIMCTFIAQQSERTKDSLVRDSPSLPLTAGAAAGTAAGAGVFFTAAGAGAEGAAAFSESASQAGAVSSSFAIVLVVDCLVIDLVALFDL